MAPKGVFRLLVLSSTLLGLGGGVAGIAFDDHFPAPLRDWVQAETDREPTGGDVVLLLAAVGFLFAYLATVVGLLVFWRPARSLGVVITVFGLSIVAALGPLVSHGWEVAVNDLSALLWGAALALAYCWPPVRAAFGRRPTALLAAEQVVAADRGPQPL